VDALLYEIQTNHMELRNFEHCSTGQIHQWLGLPAIQPIFESILVYENYPATAPVQDPNGLLLEEIRNVRSIGAQTNYAVAILAMVHDGLLLRLIYDRRRFETEATPILEHFHAVLLALAEKTAPSFSTLLATIPEREIPLFRPLTTARAGLNGIVEPRTPVEASIAGIWKDLLGLDRVGIADSLLELGGHSLLASQVLARIREVFGIDLPLSLLFDEPTVAGLARHIEARYGKESAAVPSVKPEPRNRNLPLSFAQQRLWMLEQFEASVSVYNAPASIRLSGPIDGNALAASLTEVITRHEALRTVFAFEGETPIQVILPPPALTLPTIDLTHLTDEARASEVRRLQAEEAEQPFDLKSDLLLRAKLLRVGAEEHLLLVTMHHIASDRWSFTILLRELSTLYSAYKSGNPSPLAPLPIQYPDYAIWQRERVPEEVWAAQLAYWDRQLTDAPDSADIPTDRSRPELPTYKGAYHRAALSLTVLEALKALSLDMGCTLYMTLLAAFQTLLRHMVGQDDILTGANIANRTHVELEGLIGFFVNQIVLRNDLSGNPTFRELLAKVRGTVLEGFANQDVPFDRVVANQKRKRAANRTPLFQVLFVQNTGIPQHEESGLTIHAVEFDKSTSKFDLAVFMEETPSGLIGDWVYKSDLFFASTIARMSRMLEVLLLAIVECPDIRLDDLGAILKRFEDENRSIEKREQSESSKKMFKNITPKAVHTGPEQ